MWPLGEGPLYIMLFYFQTKICKKHLKYFPRVACSGNLQLLASLPVVQASRSTSRRPRPGGCSGPSLLPLLGHLDLDRPRLLALVRHTPRLFDIQNLFFFFFFTYRYLLVPKIYTIHIQNTSH